MSIQTRVMRAVNLARERANGWAPLERDIQEKLRHRNPRLSRRQLEKLSQGNLALRLDQLDALDHYFQKVLNVRVTDPHSSPTAIDLIASHGEVCFVLGSQPDLDELNPRIDFSRWDVRAFARLLRLLQTTRPGLQVWFEDVIFRGDKAAEHFKDENAVSARETWFHEVTNDSGPSVICLGSPKANHCAEVLLSKMFGCDPFVNPRENTGLEFAFVWPGKDKRAGELSSCFILDSQRDRNRLLKLPSVSDPVLRKIAGEARDASALVVGDKFYPVNRSPGGEWKSYGIIAVSKWASRTIVCVCGLTGTATLGGASLLADLSLDLPEPRHSVSWIPFCVEVEDQPVAGEEFRKDNRRVKKEYFLGDIRHK